MQQTLHATRCLFTVAHRTHRSHAVVADSSTALVDPPGWKRLANTFVLQQPHQSKFFPFGVKHNSSSFTRPRFVFDMADTTTPDQPVRRLCIAKMANNSCCVCTLPPSTAVMLPRLLPLGSCTLGSATAWQRKPTVHEVLRRPGRDPTDCGLP